ncbi:MAG: DUF4190 domain-containing protein, partial [Phycisphaerales bacterium]
MTQFTEPRFGVNDVPTNTRTSVLAVLSLVSGLLSLIGCCLVVVSPVTGLAGILMGVIAIFAINASQGRLGGMGLAISGVVTSLIGLVLSVVIFFGINQGLSRFSAYGDAVATAQSADRTGLDKLMTSKAANEATTEGLDHFRDQTLADLGKYKRVKPGMLTFVKNFATLEKAKDIASSGKQAGFNVIPIPVEFEKGDASLFVLLEAGNPQGATPQTPYGLIVNMGVLDPRTDKVIWMIDPAAQPSGSTNTPPPTDPAAAPAPPKTATPETADPTPRT